MNAYAILAFAKKVARRAWRFVLEQVPLLEAFCVALSFHVLCLPVMWIMGWALPWPKAPPVTTVIEIDLRNFPKEANPRKVTDIYDPKAVR